MTVERIARAICLSYGQDPDDYASLLDLCGPNNEPVLQWQLYEEQAKAAIAALSAAEPVAYAVFADNGNIIIWSSVKTDIVAVSEKYGRPISPLYTAPSMAVKTLEPFAREAERWEPRGGVHWPDSTPAPADIVSTLAIGDLRAARSALSAAEPVDKCPSCGGSGHYGDAARRAIAGEIPAPSVSVKAWETNKDMLTAFGAEDIREGSRKCLGDGIEEDTWEDYYEVPFHAIDRIRLALSAQVQDIAGWKASLPKYHRYPYVVASISGKWHLRIHHGNGASHTISTHESAAEAIAAAPAKQEG